VLACTALCCDVRIVTPVSWTPSLTLFPQPPLSSHLNWRKFSSSQTQRHHLGQSDQTCLCFQNFIFSASLVRDFSLTYIKLNVKPVQFCGKHYFVRPYSQFDMSSTDESMQLLRDIFTLVANLERNCIWGMFKRPFDQRTNFVNDLDRSAEKCGLSWNRIGLL
jgi:hypothetical protein